MTKKTDKFSTKSQIAHIGGDLVVGVLVLSIGALCLAPIQNSTETNGKFTEIYRSAPDTSTSVSLMFNVYEGREEVYGILDKLQNHHARATFFLAGCWADDNVDCLREIHQKGHEIGNHGYFHKDHKTLSPLQNEKEISDCSRFIELALGKTPTLFAPPSGAYGDDMLTACQLLQMKTILWSKDTIDWRDQDATLIYTRATKNVKGGDFILMHPTKATVAALDDILNYYQTNSLTVVTVSENLQNKG